MLPVIKLGEYSFERVVSEDFCCDVKVYFSVKFTSYYTKRLYTKPIKTFCKFIQHRSNSFEFMRS